MWLWLECLSTLKPSNYILWNTCLSLSWSVSWWWIWWKCWYLDYRNNLIRDVFQVKSIQDNMQIRPDKHSKWTNIFWRELEDKWLSERRDNNMSIKTGDRQAKHKGITSPWIHFIRSIIKRGKGVRFIIYW